MKKHFAILLCAVMALLLLAGCKDPDTPSTPGRHTHTFDKEWSYDAEKHWHKSTCEHDLRAGEASHVDEDSDGNCDICGYLDPSHQHTFAEEWVNDETHHWHAATCNHVGAVSEKAEHVDENKDGVCDVCGWFDPEHTHTYSEEWTFDATHHWHAATCGHDTVSEKVEHVDENNDGACDACGWFDESHEHTFSEEWTNDSTYHWHAATCEHDGAVSNKEAHADADEDGKCDACGMLICNHKDINDDGICDICGGVIDPEHEHTFSDAWSSNASGHWHAATCHLGAATEPEAHVDENKDGKCDICEFVVCAHSYATEWSSNETHHWHEVTCGCRIDKGSYGPHVDKDGKAGCDICLYGAQAVKGFEMVKEKEPLTIQLTNMLTVTSFNINLPKAGSYLIVPSSRDVQFSMSDEFDMEKPCVAKVDKAGSVEVFANYFNFDWQTVGSYKLTYSVLRLEDLVLADMKGKAELPANVYYIVTFKAPKAGTYKLNSSVAGVEMGVMPADKEEPTSGDVSVVLPITLKAKEAGEEIRVIIRYANPSKVSFQFDWSIEEPFEKPVEAGETPVVVAAHSSEYKTAFVADKDGSYLFELVNGKLYIGQWDEKFEMPLSTGRSWYLTANLKAGEKVELYMLTANEAVGNVSDTLRITYVGTRLENGNSKVTVGASGSQFTIVNSGNIAYYTLSVNGGQVGVVKADGSVEYANEQEIRADANGYCTFWVKRNGGAGEVTLNSKRMVYTMSVSKSSPTVIEMAAGKDYTVELNNIPHQYLYTLKADNAGVKFFVNGKPAKAPLSREYLPGDVITVRLENTTNATVTFTLTHDDPPKPEQPDPEDPSKPVEGVSGGPMTLDESITLAVKDAFGCTVTFTAETAGQYTLHSESAKALVIWDNEIETQEVLTGAGAYAFTLEAGQTITFVVCTTDNEPASITLTVTKGR